MVYLIYSGVTLIFIFGFVILFGAPYLPTLKNQINSAFELLDLKAGQVLLELGSGDGRILYEAGKRGFKAVGYEINPLLVLYSKIKTWKYRDNVKIVWGNYWNKKWPQADGIFVFLLDRYMLKLNNKIIQEYKDPINLVSFTFKIPNKKTTDSKQGLFLYRYNQAKKVI